MAAQRPIKQTDGYNCGVHCIELICQLACEQKSPTKYLSRDKICDSLIKWGYMSKFHYQKHPTYEEVEIVSGGDPGDQKSKKEFLPIQNKKKPSRERSERTQVLDTSNTYE